MNEKTMEQLRKRLDWRLRLGPMPGTLDAILEDVVFANRVDVALEKRRVVFVQPGVSWDAACERHPLPSRTRKVLREEPVPGTTEPVYRWANGRLEFRAGSEWARSASILHRDDSHIDLLRHAVDLHDNPYRTEEVPVDPDNLWGEEEL